MTAPMCRCPVQDCPGHDTLSDVLIHGQHHTLALLYDVTRQLSRIEIMEETIMADVDQLAADFATFKTDVDTAVSDLKTELANALANQGGIPPAVQTKLDDLDAAVQAADAALTQPTPAPQPPTP